MTTKTVFLSFLVFTYVNSAFCISNKYVSIGAIDPIQVKAGRSVEVVIPVIVADGFHVQSNSSQLIPTALEFQPNAVLKASAPVYPKGKPYRMPGGTGEVSTYEGKIEIKLTVTALPTAKDGSQKLEGKLRYQACNEKNCFFPTTTPIELAIKTVSK
jgi:hypothetical protein